MSLNLISNSWIPVRMEDGSTRVIAPHQMADPSIAAPDWPRADLNLACYEFLVGLVFMTCPPTNLRDWAHNRPDQALLQERLSAFLTAFDLLGDGPRFLQDRDHLNGAPSSTDMLFIDSAGGNAAKNNADLMVHRDRYGALDLPLAAMALYAFQQFAPAGGAGNRTSMRGGGPLVTLVDPGTGLWDLVWANVPFGQPASAGDLPWMRGTRTSEKAQQVTPSQAHPVEAFFGMPRRLRLVGDDRITGVVQRPYGTNYALWRHPLTPYYRMKEGAELLPRHPAGGRLPYRNWAGTVLAQPGDNLRLRATSIDGVFDRFARAPTRMIAAGWAMDNMKPKDFLWAELPLLSFDAAAQARAEALIVAADTVTSGLRRALTVIVEEGSAREAELDRFWSDTEADFTKALAELSQAVFDTAAISLGFLAAIGRQALRQFEALALPGLADRKMEKAGQIVAAHRGLRSLVQGHGAAGKKLWAGLDLTPPDPTPQLQKEVDA
ncbi:type I-E CRISPR-associated protein Cse1/CasA [Nioella nitratireducens]|uniref:type I-E CRISPR-associated protein Cse1/CasA n=1 Tax=Nioella nitratireducens TaxID=1287720 RepID=UPI0008FCEF8A|nr:type I-E CRISPR-associated protein Cse1/CasA [Nioella nitratireducens]